MDPETLISYGSEVKALPDGTVKGYGVVFGGKDLVGEHFEPDTYYGSRGGAGADVLFHHGIPLKPELAGYADHLFPPIKSATVDEHGIFIETVFNLADEYEKTVHEAAKAGKLGWSSGAPAHMVRRDGSGKITRWPLSEFSLTPTPCEPRASAFTSLKSAIAVPVSDDMISALTLPSAGGTAGMKDVLSEGSGYAPFSPRLTGGIFPTPPAVRSNARTGLQHHEQTGHGSDLVVGFANRLVGDGLDGEGVKALAAHFAEHPHDGSTTDAEGKPTKSLVTHLLRGGDAGEEWAKGCCDSMKAIPAPIADTDPTKSYITAEERRNVPKEDFGDPDNEAYPIRAGEHAQQDLEDAARLIGHAKDPEKVKARLIAIAHRMKLTLPEAWKEDAGKSLPLAYGPDGRLLIPTEGVKAVLGWLGLTSDTLNNLTPDGGSLSGLPLAVHSELVLSANEELTHRLEAKSLLDGVKAGRQLSAANRQRLQTHVDAAQTLHQGLSQFMDECDKAGEEEEAEGAGGSPAGMSERRKVQVGEKMLSPEALAAQRDANTLYVNTVLKRFNVDLPMMH